MRSPREAEPGVVNEGTSVAAGGTRPAVREARRFIVYMLVGLLGTAGHYATLVMLVRGGVAGPVVASATGFTVGAVINYFANYYVTFRSRRRHGRAFVQFFLVALAGLGVNTAIMAAVTGVLGWHYLVAQVLATGTVVVMTFVANRWWTFREAEHD